MSSDSEDDFFYTNSASMLKALKKDISFSEEKNARLDLNDEFTSEMNTIDDEHSPIKKTESRTNDDASMNNDSCIILSDDELLSSSVNLLSKIDSVLVRKNRSNSRNKCNIKGKSRGRKSISTSRRTTRQNTSLLDDDVSRNNDSLVILSDDDLQSPPINLISKIDSVLVNGKRRSRSSSRKTPNSKGKGRGRKTILTPRKSKRQTKQISNNYEISHRVNTISTAHKNKPDICTIDDNNDLQEANYEVVIKVLWMSQYVKKFSIRRFDKVQPIFKHFSETENTPENKLIFTIEKDGVILSKNDTPDSLNINAATIIEGGIKSTERNQSNVTNKQDKDCIEIKIQLKDKKRPLSITMRRIDRMEVLMHKTATELDVKVNSLKFYFDGDLIKSNDTIDDLQLEGGECIDCIKV